LSIMGFSNPSYREKCKQVLVPLPEKSIDFVGAFFN